MFTVKRRMRWSLLSVVCALALSGTSKPRQVAAHTQDADRESRGEPGHAPEAADPAPVAAASRTSGALLRSIPAGDYLPFYKGKSGARSLVVPAFKVAASAVTRQEYLGFVRDNPRWRRSRVERLFAEVSYLDDWSDDLNFGSSPATRAVTGVAWFAAKAYCASMGQRLPSTVEWERALKIVGPAFVDSTGASSGANLAASLWEWTADFNSVPLADGDPNDSVASLFCGAGARATDASDYAAFLRYSFRSSLKADFALKNLGFRCAEDGS
jgi:formylglycine-generating enzyme required for sulfatase activity